MKSLLDCFDLVKVVSLRDREDRRREMRRELAALGLELADGRVEFFDGVRVREAAGFPAPGVRGCYLSHLGVLREARRRGVDSVLVLEDDLEVSPVNRRRLEQLVPAICSESWDFLYLGHREPVHADGEAALAAFERPIVTAHMYAVRARVLPALISYLEACLMREPGDPVGGPMHVDGAISMFRVAHPEFVTLISVPSLGGQRSSRSDIHTSRLDQVPGLRDLAGWARRVRRSLQGGRAA